MIRLEGVYFGYKRYFSSKENNVLNDINLNLDFNETLGLTGVSGCGKTTVAKVILRLLDVNKGKLFFEGEDITKKASKELLSFRKNVQLISQRPESSFDPRIKFNKSLIEPLKNFDIYEKNEYSEIVKKLLEKVKLNVDILERYPHQVSGGEIQRLAICRALLLKPKVLILDEVTSMLDISVQAQILKLFKDLKDEYKLSYLLIAHDLDVVNFMSDRVLKMENGMLI